jgi:hypothetical protein
MVTSRSQSFWRWQIHIWYAIFTRRCRAKSDHRHFFERLPDGKSPVNNLIAIARRAAAVTI